MSAANQEFALIEWIRSHVGTDPRVPLGIGDDAALLRRNESGECLVAVDLLMEGVHFTFPPATPPLAGRKALAVNLSDIAAMAGQPTAAFVAVALPRGRDPRFARQAHEGLLQLAAEHQVIIAGGDTNSWNGPLVICVTVIGEVIGRGAVRRSGARPGDWIMTTGSFGGSLASGRHLTFPPRVNEAQRLHAAAELHAMIDVSDGLAADLFHILDESRAGAVLRAEAIPISEAALANDGRSPLLHALGDGEDFELLFTVSPEDGRRLLRNPPVDVPLSHIGEIVTGSGCQLVATDGNITPLPRLGWEHQF